MTKDITGQRFGRLIAFEESLYSQVNIVKKKGQR